MAKLKKVLEKREGEFSSYRNCWLFSVSLSAMLIGERKAKRTRSWLIPQPLARIGLAQQSKAILLDSDLLPVVVAFGLTSEALRCSKFLREIPLTEVVRQGEYRKAGTRNIF